MHRPQVTGVSFERFSATTGVLRIAVRGGPINAFYNTFFSLPRRGRAQEILVPVEGNLPVLDDLLAWEYELVAPIVARLIEETVSSRQVNEEKQNA